MLGVNAVEQPTLQGDSHRGSKRPDGCRADAGCAGEAIPASDPPGQGRYRRAMMETSVLLCLLQNEMHGYELVDRIEQMVGSYVCVDPGSTYRLLRDLESGGHLVSTWQPAESGPARRTYRVTESGRELLGQWATFLEKRARVMGRLVDSARQLLAADGDFAE